VFIRGQKPPHSSTPLIRPDPTPKLIGSSVPADSGEDHTLEHPLTVRDLERRTLNLELRTALRRLTRSDGFLTGLTLTKPASILRPDGLTAQTTPGRVSLALALDLFRRSITSTRYDTFTTFYVASLSAVCISSCKASSQASRRKVTQGCASQNIERIPPQPSRIRLQTAVLLEIGPPAPLYSRQANCPKQPCSRALAALTNGHECG